LEHRTAKGVFTRHRQAIVQFLSTQAAISLQNAELYDRAQVALRDLQQAQLQLVQSEKMSALGNLVAGVAHEINNPLGFIVGNIELARENLTDLLEHLALYEDNASATELACHAEDIDLEYLKQDLPTLLDSMNVGVERIKNISTSLRIFSRQDRDDKTAFKINDGIDSTLLILKHRTKPNDRRPAIEIVKEYGDIPEVLCFPGQLNQVFMNILANAIDAFDEANEGKTYSEIEASPNRITIRTAMVDDWVEILIIDNGCGMKPETKDRIFEHGFTTKGVGKGTGLGMAIAYNIITEKHEGTIACDSTLGVGTSFTIKLPML
jgi:signal transduction histidine kinase